MAQMNPGAAGGAGLLGAGVDKEKAFLAEKENLEVVMHWWVGDGVEKRVLDLYT